MASEHRPSAAATQADRSAVRRDEPLIAITNLPDRETAEDVAEILVRERLAACVNVLAPCHSIYRWQGDVERAEEIPLLIKTTVERYVALQSRLVELHPYDVPELIAWRADAVLESYASWMAGACRPVPKG